MNASPAAGLLAGVLLALACSLPAAALELHGHRGARGLAPENTMAGFERALAVGVDVLELDVGLTRDGVLAVAHDRRLNPDLTRGPDGRHLSGPGPALVTLGFDELQAFDVGRIDPRSRYAAQFPQQQPVDGARIPRLEQVLELARRPAHESLRLAIEAKVSPLAPQESAAPQAFAQALVDAIRRAGLTARAEVLSFDWRVLQAVQALAPEVGTVYLSAEQRWLDNIGRDRGSASPWTAGLRLADHGSLPRMIHAAGGRTWSAWHGDLDAARVREARGLGLKVLAWTVNDPARIEQLIDLGVDGIVTDHPERVREVMRRRGLPLPAARAPGP